MKKIGEEMLEESMVSEEEADGHTIRSARNLDLRKLDTLIDTQLTEYRFLK
jgi:hypothetical protein